MKKALIISYYFPPMNTPGAFRSGKFAKFLPEFGWEPVILTTEPKSYNRLDSKDLDQISNKIVIKTIPANDLSFKGISKLTSFLPLAFSNGLFWKKEAISEGMKLIQKHNIQIIYSTALPPICHIVANNLKNITGLPLILDYRDLWTDNPYKRKFAKLIRLADFFIERKIINNSDFIIGISSTIIENIKKNFSYKGICEVIPNGFDPSDFNNQNYTVDDYTISHIGNIYEKRVPVTIEFLKRMYEVEKKYPEEAQKILIQFVGNVDKSILDFSNKNFTKMKFSHLCKVNHQRAIEIMCSSDILLLILEKEDSNSITSKIFEYIASLRKIFIIGRSSELTNLVRKFENTFFINDFDTEDLKNLIFHKIDFQDSDEQGKININKILIKEYSRYEQTSKLVKIFETVISRNSF